MRIGDVCLTSHPKTGKLDKEEVIAGAALLKMSEEEAER